MFENIEITDIHLNFKHNNRQYLVFSTNHSKYYFLYFNHEEKTIRSLFYGNDFLNLIISHINNPNVECLECQLGTHIKGGISIDGLDKVKFNITLKDANKILKKLKRKIKNNTSFIEYF